PLATNESSIRQTRANHSTRHTLAPNIVAPKHSEIAEVESAIGDDWISPGFRIAAFGLVGWRKTAFFAVAVRRGLDQVHGPVLAVKVEAALSITDRSGANGWI